jgi:hypothetical protein
MKPRGPGGAGATARVHTARTGRIEGSGAGAKRRKQRVIAFLTVGSYVLVALLSFTSGVLLDQWRRGRDGRAACRALYAEARAISEELSARKRDSSSGYTTPDAPIWDQVDRVVAGHIRREDFQVLRDAYVARRQAVNAATAAFAGNPADMVSSIWLAQHRFAVSAVILYAYGWPSVTHPIARAWDREARFPVCRRPTITKALADDPRVLAGVLLHYAIDDKGKLVLIDER